MKVTKKLSYLLVLLVAFSTLSCKKSNDASKDDTTGGNDNQNLEVISIQSLRESGDGTIISDNKKIEGIVISSKISEAEGGVVLQDETGGVYLNLSALKYALGDKLSIKVSKKRLREYEGRIQIMDVKDSDVSVASDLLPLTPKALTVNQVLEDKQKTDHTLISLANVRVELLNDLTSVATYSIRDVSGSIRLNVPTEGNTLKDFDGAKVTGYYKLVDNIPTFFIRQNADVISESTPALPIDKFLTEDFQDAGGKMTTRKSNYFNTSNTVITTAKGTIWNFTYALIESIAQHAPTIDWRDQSPRLVGQNTRENGDTPGPGSIATQFKITGLKRLTVKYAGVFEVGADKGPFAIATYVSKDNGTTWLPLGGNESNSAVGFKEKIATASFYPNAEISNSDEVLVKIVNTSTVTAGIRGNRVNILQVTFDNY